jgi:hypothetical protein
VSEDERSKGWWQTLPGIITGVTATITALAGLIVAVNQTGWFGPRERTAVTASPPSAPAAAPDPTAPPEPGRDRTVATSPSPPSATSYSIALPALRDYTLGPSASSATFTLLRAEVSSQTAEKAGLRIRLRMTNRSPYETNFWDSSFRLIVDDAPMAPEGGLNELVPGEAAKEGDVIFAISRGTAGARLKVTFNGDSTEIPLDLAPPR